MEGRLETLPMRHRSSSTPVATTIGSVSTVLLAAALGLCLPGCDDQPEDPIGVPWAPAGSAGSADTDDSSGWGDATATATDGSDSWGDDSGDPSDPSGGASGGDPTDPSAGTSGGSATAGDDSAGDDSAGDDSAGDGGESTGGDPGMGGESPYVGGWDVGACDDVSGAGDTIVGLDQHGDNVYLRDFCHKAVLFVIGNFT
jgi:hypothetical protein